jgi:hypothetical protein
MRGAAFDDVNRVQRRHSTRHLDHRQIRTGEVLTVVWMGSFKVEDTTSGPSYI